MSVTPPTDRFAVERADLLRRLADGCEAGLNPPVGFHDHQTGDTVHASVYVEHAEDVYPWAVALGQPVDTYGIKLIEAARFLDLPADAPTHRHTSARVNLLPGRWVEFQHVAPIGGGQA